MVKSYDRYEFEDCFGVVSSKTSNSVFLNHQYVLSGNDECVSIWNLNEKEIRNKLIVPFTPPYYFFTYHVCYITINEKNKKIVAVGYVNGSIRLFDLVKGKILSTFSGHTSAITKLVFHKQGNLLASASKDTSIIIWDVVNDVGLFKLEEHTNIVTDLAFLQMKKEYLNEFVNSQLMISVSKDCLIKLWDLNIQSSLQTVMDCEEEIHCMQINEPTNRLIIACNSFLRIYRIHLYSKEQDPFTKAPVYITFLANIKRTQNCKIQNMYMIFSIENEHLDDGGDKEGMEWLLQYQGGGTALKDTPINREKIVEFLNKTNQEAKICGRVSYCDKGDNNGILLCCTNTKKVEFYKINSMKNQKKSEKTKKKRYIEKLKKRKNLIVEEQKRVEQFKGKQSSDYTNLQQKLDELDKEIEIYNTYEIHTVKDEIKFLFSYTCKSRLQNLDIYRRSEKDSFVYLLMSFVTNQLKVFTFSLEDLLYNKDEYIVKKKKHSKNVLQEEVEDLNENKTDESGDDHTEGEEEKDNDKNNKEKEKEKDEEREDDEEIDNIVEKKIFDYSKCFIEVSEINKGHNNAIDFLGLSDDNSLLVSICRKCVKIWSMRNLQNIINIPCEKGTSAFFSKNNEYLLVSDEYGYIFLYDLKNIEVKYMCKAHAGKIVIMCRASRGNIFLSVGDEKYLKLHQLVSGKNEDKEEETDSEEEDFSKNKEEVKEEETANAKSVSLKFKETHCHALLDKVSSAVFSKDEKFIALGYFNNLIEVLYSDSLKLHLTLYGHSLPITCLDISKDGKILASSAADKNLFLWNLEYGNINKRIQTHCDVLTKICFFNAMNHLISISRDGLIKLWDAQKYECICTMDGIFGCLTSLVIHSKDEYFLTAGVHKSIRYWKRGEDLLFLEEEREKELNLQIEKEAIRNDIAYPSSIERSVLLNKATIKTIDSIRSSEKLIEYIDIIDEELVLLETYYKNLKSYKEAKLRNELPDFVQPPIKPQSKPELLNKNPYEFIIEVLCNIKNNLLQEVLISLPFSYAFKLLDYIKTFLKSFYFLQQIQNNRNKFVVCGNFNFYVECTIHIVLSIINIYRNQFLFDQKFRNLLHELQMLITPHLKRAVELCSFNQSSLSFLMNGMDDEGMDFDAFNNEHFLKVGDIN